MSVFKIRSCLLFVIPIVMQGFLACKSDDVAPQSPPPKSFEQIRNLISANHWQEVPKPTDTSNIIFLKDSKEATPFFQNLKSNDSPETSRLGQSNDEMVLSRGVFTFLNGEIARFNFNSSLDGKGEIIEVELDSSKVTFTQKDNYVEISKWATIALPMYEEEVNRLGGYQYYYVPVATYKAFLEKNGWSSVQFLMAAEQANFEGEGGTWEEFYLSRNPAVSPKNALLAKNAIPSRNEYRKQYFHL